MYCNFDYSIYVTLSGFYAADSTHRYSVWETQSLVEFLTLNLQEKKKEKKVFKVTKAFLSL